jgi:MerR family transcriptional regulator, repressor of the yfmOP operon
VKNGASTDGGDFGIGRAAQLSGVTTRTLRYYEQLGLLTPSGRTEGGTRRYDLDDLARVGRIRRLQEVLGHDLARIAVVLQAEDRLSALRVEWFEQDDTRRREMLLEEAININDRLRAEVAARREALEHFASELEEKARQYRQVRSRLRRR